MRSLIKQHWKKALAYAFLFTLGAVADIKLVVFIGIVWAFFWALDQVAF